MTETVHRIPVEGGELVLGETGPADGDAVLAIHGITANRRSWLAVARAIPELRLLAPDLRGRADSRALGAPHGIRQHAEDLLRALDELGLDRVVVAGHSMGAFVAVALAAAAPDRVRSLVLLDGGFPLARPDGIDDAGLAAAVLGPAVARLAMTFPDPGAYLDFWRAHPAFAADQSADVEAYAEHDLVPAADGVRPSADPAAVGADVLELYGADWHLAALEALRHPAVVLRAPRGLLDEPPGLYPPGALERWCERLPRLRLVEVPEVNHYTILMSPRGATAVAAELLTASAAPEESPSAPAIPDTTTPSSE